MHSTNPRDEILKAISIRVCESCEQPIIWLHAKMIYPVTTIIVEKVDMSPQAFSMSHAVVAPGKKGRRTKNEQQSNRSSRPESKTE